MESKGKVNMKDYITIIGGGLAGTEAAYQIAKEGIKVKLYEMKPKKFSPAHSNENLAEIVCSNSFKSNLHTNACGLLKEELSKYDVKLDSSNERFYMDKINEGKKIINKLYRA